MRNHCTVFAVVLAGVLAGLSSSAFADHPSMGLGIGAAAPISTISAVPIPKGMWSIGVQAEFDENDDFSDKELLRFADKDPDADVHSVDSLFSLVGGVAYGLTDDLNLGLRLPYVRRNNIREAEHHHAAENEIHGSLSKVAAHGEEEEKAGAPGEITHRGDSEGLGDLTLYGQYRVYGNLDLKTHVSLLLGVKVPTGTTDEEDQMGERFETEMQPGSGSWDPLFGVALTKQWSKLSFDSSYLYSIATEGAQDTELGDAFAYNFALSYRLGSGEDGSGYHQHGHDREGGHHSHTGFPVDLIVELNGEWRGKEEEGGRTDDNSGGHIIYISPGIRFSTAGGLAASISTGLPALTDLNGNQVDPDYRLIGSLSWCF